MESAERVKLLVDALVRDAEARVRDTWRAHVETVLELCGIERDDRGSNGRPDRERSVEPPMMSRTDAAAAVEVVADWLNEREQWARTLAVLAPYLRR